MQEKWGRFDLTLFKSQETDAFVARGWKISKCQWPIWVHHNLSPSYFTIKYSSQQLTCTGRTVCHAGNSVFTANLFRRCDSSLLVKITRLNSDYRVTFTSINKCWHSSSRRVAVVSRRAAGRSKPAMKSKKTFSHPTNVCKSNWGFGENGRLRADVEWAVPVSCCLFYLMLLRG